MKGKSNLNTSVKEKQGTIKPTNKQKESSKEGIDTSYKKKFGEVMAKNSQAKINKANESNLSDTISLETSMVERPKGIKTDSTKEIHSILKGIYFYLFIKDLIHSQKIITIPIIKIQKVIEV